MSGLISYQRYSDLFPLKVAGRHPDEVRFDLAVVQSICEGITGLHFGSEVYRVMNPAADRYRLYINGGVFEIGDSVRLLGGGVTATPFEVLDIGSDTAGGLDRWIEVESVGVAIAPIKALQVVEHIGAGKGGYLDVSPKPVFQVVSLLTRNSKDALFTDTDGSVTTLAATDYEIEKVLGINVGVRVRRSSVPLIADRGKFMLKHADMRFPDSVLVRYAAGFYPIVPHDLENAAAQMVNEVRAIMAASASTGGLFQSESHDYYSYTRMSQDELAKFPHSALAILRGYAGL